MKHCSVCNNSFEDTVTFCPRDGEVLQESPETIVGRVIDGKYEVETFIAQGGMGAVYLARHILLGDRVVLKTLRSEMRTNAEWVKRFQREGKAARAFRHPNSVTVYDLAAGSDGLVYMVMEYVEGHTLDKELKRRGRLTPREAVEVLTPVADVLDAAHARGVVHRDLKPENIMLGRDERGERLVKVLDLGIAKLVGGDAYASSATALTTAGQILGTPYYMSPEQWGELPRDGRAEVDGRTDVYSLGVIAFELVAGRKPHTGQTLAELRQKHVFEPSPPLAEVAPDVTPEFAAAVAHATAKDRADRPAAAGEFVDELRAALGLPPRSRARAAADAGGDTWRTHAGGGDAATAHLAPGTLDQSRAETLLTSEFEGQATGGGRAADTGATRPAPRRGGGRSTVASNASETVVDAPEPRAGETAAGEVVTPAAQRRLSPLILGGALALLVLAAAGVWLASRPAQGGQEQPAQPTANVPSGAASNAPAPPTAPKAEALSYWIEVSEGIDQPGQRASDVTVELDSNQFFRFHFTPREQGYLYLIGPKGEGNKRVTMLTADGGFGLDSNSLLDDADFAFPRGRGRFRLRGEPGATEGYTVIFSKSLLREPSFLTAEALHDLTDDEVIALDELRARHRADAPALETRGEGGERRVVVSVPEGATARGALVIFDIRIKLR